MRISPQVIAPVLMFAAVIAACVLTVIALST
jgi:hypothetical protein